MNSLDSFFDALLNGDFFNYYLIFYAFLGVLGIFLIIRAERRKKARKNIEDEDTIDELD